MLFDLDLAKVSFATADQIATIDVELKSFATPIRLRITPQSFPVGSLEAQALEIARKASSFQFKPNISKEQQKRYSTKWSTVVDLRKTSPSGNPSNEWWLAKEVAEFDTDRVVGRYEIFEGGLPLPTPPWLQDTSSTEFVDAFPVQLDRNATPIPLIPSARAYETLHTKAILYDRADNHKRQEEQYNPAMIYPVRFRGTEVPHRCTIDIKMAPFIPFARGQTAIIPNEEDEVFLKPQGSDVEIEGKVEEYEEDGYHFRLHADMPPPDTITHINDSNRNAYASLRWDFLDITSDIRLSAVRWAAYESMDNVERDPAAVSAHLDTPDRVCRPLLIHDVILDQKKVVFSPNLIYFFSKKNTLSDDDAVRMMVKICQHLNQEQTNIFTAVIKGVEANVTFLEGVPGSGKSTCLAWIIAAITYLGGLTVISSQSNTGVDALFDKLIEHLGTDPSLAGLRNRCVRFRSSRYTIRQIKQLVFGQATEDQIGKYSMAATILRFVENNPDTVNVPDFQAHVDS